MYDDLAQLLSQEEFDEFLRIVNTYIEAQKINKEKIMYRKINRQTYMRN